MPGIREQKRILKEKLSQEDWLESLPEIVNSGMKVVPALFSFLLLDPQTGHRAAKALGETVANINATDPETAKNIIRRYMWHMNEDSGNIGWGIPWAFAETLAASPALAKEYARILISYIMDLGIADNFVDYAQLRRQCYWAAGRLAQAYPEKVEKYRQWLIKGLMDEDEICRGYAAWALSWLSPDLMAVPLLKSLASLNSPCDIFDENRLKTFTVGDLAKNCLAAWKNDL